MKDEKLMEMFKVEELEQRLEMKRKFYAEASSSGGGSVKGGFSWEF